MESFFFIPSFPDISWIKDRSCVTDFLQLRESLTNSYPISVYKPFDAYSSMDTASIFGGIWESSIKQANYDFTKMMYNMQELQNFMPDIITPGTQGITHTDATTADPEGSSELSEEDKSKFEEHKNEFQDLHNRLSELDADTLKTLGLDTILKRANEKFAKAKKPEDIEACIKIINDAIAGIKESTLKDILKYKVPPENLEIDSKVSELYDTKLAIRSNDSGNSYENLLISDGARLVTNETIIPILDKGYAGGEKQNILEVLTNRNHSGKDTDIVIKSTKAIVSSLLEKASEDGIEAYTIDAVQDACNTLRSALTEYQNNPKDKAKINTLNKAFKNLYVQMKVALAQYHDNLNKEKILDKLPDEIRSHYVDENNNLRDNYKINENKIKRELKRLGDVNATINSQGNYKDSLQTDQILSKNSSNEDRVSQDEEEPKTTTEDTSSYWETFLNEGLIGVFNKLFNRNKN